MTEYVCEKCIHRYPKGGCLVPSNLGYVEQCKHFTEESKPKPMTNEEWFCGLSTEEKAKFLRQIYRDGRDDYVGEWYEQTESDFIEWLKQPHT